jgi:hypothetical protein
MTSRNRSSPEDGIRLLVSSNASQAGIWPISESNLPDLAISWVAKNAVADI